MNKSKLLKIGSYLLATALLVSSFAGCTSGSGSSTTESSTASGSESSESSTAATGDRQELLFSSWANTGEIPVLSKAVDAYNAMQDKVKVTFVNQPGEGYEQKLITSLAGGTASDVFYVGDTYMSKLIANGTILPLNDFMATEESYCKVEDFAEGLWGAAKTADGKVYGITVDCNPFLMYYSPKMMEEIGAKSPQAYYDEGKWNWEAFDEVIGKLNAAGKKGFIMNSDATAVYRFAFSNGGTIWDGETYKFDDKAKEAFNYIAERMKDGRFVYSGSLPKGQGEDASFMSGQAGFVTAGRWLTPTFVEAKVDFDYIPYPSNTADKVFSNQIAVAYMSVNAKSKFPEEAMKFATYYCGQGGQSDRLAGVGNAIPSISGLESIITDSKVPEHVQYLFDVRDAGWAAGAPVAKDALYPGMNEELKSLIEEIYVNGKSVDEMLPKIEDTANKLVAESKAG